MFTIISVVIFCLGIWVFGMEAMELAGAITVLTGPYLLTNVVSKFAPIKKEK